MIPYASTILGILTFHVRIQTNRSTPYLLGNADELNYLLLGAKEPQRNKDFHKSFTAEGIFP